MSLILAIGCMSGKLVETSLSFFALERMMIFSDAQCREHVFSRAYPDVELDDVRFDARSALVSSLQNRETDDEPGQLNANQSRGSDIGLASRLLKKTRRSTNLPPTNASGKYS